jgi:hypothetical protein
MKGKLVKFTDDDAEAIQAKADRHTGGNVSAWLRHAGKRYEPAGRESIPVGRPGPVGTVETVKNRRAPRQKRVIAKGAGKVPDFY